MTAVKISLLIQKLKLCNVGDNLSHNLPHKQAGSLIRVNGEKYGEIFYIFFCISGDEVKLIFDLL